MSDRGRSRRTARPTKATPPKAAPDTEVEPTADAESDTTATAEAATGGSTASPAGETVSLGKDDDADAEAPADGAGDEATAGTTAETTAEAAAEDGDDPDAAAGDDPDAAADGDDPDASADEDESEKSDSADKSAKAKNAKDAAPLTKAEKRAAARVAAAKAARRRRAGQAIAGTIIVLLAVGGAFAGVYYFGDRAEKNRVKCKPVGDPNAFPPLLGGMDKALGTEPAVAAGNADIKAVDKKVLIKGDCKTVKAGQTVTVNYVGVTLKDGKVFGSSWAQKQTFDTPVGLKSLGKEQKLLLPLDDGLVGLKVGTRVQFDIPASMAYGDDPPQGAPAGAVRFVFDILNVKDTEDAGLPAGFGG